MSAARGGAAGSYPAVRTSGGFARPPVCRPSRSGVICRASRTEKRQALFRAQGPERSDHPTPGEKTGPGQAESGDGVESRGVRREEGDERKRFRLPSRVVAEGEPCGSEGGSRKSPQGGGRRRGQRGAARRGRRRRSLWPRGRAQLEGARGWLECVRGCPGASVRCPPSRSHRVGGTRGPSPGGEGLLS